MRIEFTAQEQAAADELVVQIVKTIGLDIPAEKLLAKQDIKTEYVSLTYTDEGMTIEIAPEVTLQVVDLYRTIFTAGFVAYQAAKPLLLEAQAKHVALSKMMSI